MTNKIENIVKEIQFKTDQSLEQIAATIGYSRPHLNKAKNSGVEGKVLEALKNKYKEILQNVPTPYTEQRLKQKNADKADVLDYYDACANAGSNDVEILPAKKRSGVVVSELFKGSKYVIRIAGNSMTPLYPPGGILGIKPVDMISPGGVYVVETNDGQLWIKRLFYKDDNQDAGLLQLVSDNVMKHESGPRMGKLFYPDFFINLTDVKNLFIVTGVFKSNIITILNDN